MTRTEELTNAINDIVRNHHAEIDVLPTRGPNGGANARNIDGWSHSPNGTITRAANLSNCPVMHYWDGPLPTPASAIPTCIIDEVSKAYNHIFA